MSESERDPKAMCLLTQMYEIEYITWGYGSIHVFESDMPDTCRASAIECGSQAHLFGCTHANTGGLNDLQFIFFFLSLCEL